MRTILSFFSGFFKSLIIAIVTTVLVIPFTAGLNVLLRLHIVYWQVVLIATFVAAALTIYSNKD